jgi:hypothetical protein
MSKVIYQLVCRSDGSGVARYTNELHNLLLSEEDIVTDVIQIDTEFDRKNKRGGTQLFKYTLMKADNDTASFLNKADLVIVNSLPDKKDPDREKVLDFVKDSITTKKYIVINDHDSISLSSFQGDILHRKYLILSFDGIVSFDERLQPMKAIKELIGENEFSKRFKKLIHPYSFGDTSNWMPASEKNNRITYLGRFSWTKDPQRLIRGQDTFFKYGFATEMVGIKRTIATACCQNFLYEFNVDEFYDKGVRADAVKLGPSKKTDPEGSRHAIIKKEQCNKVLTQERDPNKTYLFGSYKRELGLEIIRHSAFMADFYSLIKTPYYGNTLEYVLYEAIDYGTIPLMDFSYGESIFVNGKSLVELNAGIFLKRDLSNIDDVCSKMKELLSDNNLYHNYLLNIVDVAKKLTDKKTILDQLI